MMEEIIEKVQGFGIWIGISFALVVIAMIIDLMTGIMKANRKGELTTSSGLRKTCNKATKYFLPILSCACIDIMLSALSIYEVPFFTIFFAAFCMIIEFKSVIENTRTVNETKEMAKVIAELISKKDDSTELLSAILKNVITDDRNDVTSDKVINTIKENGEM